MNLVFNLILQFLSNDAVATVCLCILASLSVALLMRFFVKKVFEGTDKYIKATYEEASKIAGIYASVKSVIYTATAFVLTGIALAMLMKVCKFPFDNSVYLAWLYFIPMVFVQFLFDKNLKALACKWFGIEVKGIDDDEETEEEKPKKVRKPKVYTRKVKYTIDEEGNEVTLD